LLIGSKRHCLPAVSHEVGTEDGAHADGGTGALELDRTVDAVGVGAGQGAEAALRRSLGQRLGAGDAESEGEVGVDVKMGEHSITKA
jgi:hypothetical protein